MACDQFNVLCFKSCVGVDKILRFAEKDLGSFVRLFSRISRWPARAQSLRFQALSSSRCETVQPSPQLWSWRHRIDLESRSSRLFNHQTGEARPHDHHPRKRRLFPKLINRGSNCIGFASGSVHFFTKVYRRFKTPLDPLHSTTAQIEMKNRPW